MKIIKNSKKKTRKTKFKERKEVDEARKKIQLEVQFYNDYWLLRSI